MCAVVQVPTEHNKHKQRNPNSNNKIHNKRAKNNKKGKRNRILKENKTYEKTKGKKNDNEMWEGRETIRVKNRKKKMVKKKKKKKNTKNKEIIKIIKEDGKMEGEMEKVNKRYERKK